MSTDNGAGLSAYKMCSEFLLPDMFKDAKNRWAYNLICKMYASGYTKTSECDIFEYLCSDYSVPEDKVGGICCYLIEVYIQFCNMTNPITGVRWTVGEAVDELIRLSDTDEWEILTK